MVNREVIEIIIKAQDQASQIAQKVENAMDGLGNIGNKAMSKVNNALDKFKTGLSNVSSKVTSLKNGVSSAFTSMTNSILNSSKGITTLTSNLAKVKSKVNEVKNAAVSAFDSITAKLKGNSITAPIISALETLKSKASTTAEAIKTSLSTAVDVVKSKFQSITTTATSVTSSITTAFSGVVSSISSTFSNVSSTITSSFSSLSSSLSSIGSSISSKFSSVFSSLSSYGSSAVDKIKGKFTNLNTVISSSSSAVQELGGLFTTVFGTIGLSQIYDWTIGLSMGREQMSSLMEATMGSKEEAAAFVDVMDELTNNSLVSLDSLGTAMSQIKMSTGMTNDELKSILPTVNDIGQRAILMGKDTDEATQLMVAAYRGLNGEFDMLNANFGISSSLLQDLGWSGASDDVEGYTEALNKALERSGNMDGMLDTTTGKTSQIESAFRIAGRTIGNVFMPVINAVLDALVWVSQTCPEVYTVLIVLAAGFALVAVAIGGWLMLSPIIASVNASLATLGVTLGGLVVEVLIVVAVVAAAVLIFLLLYNRCESFRNIIQGLISALKGCWEWVKQLASVLKDQLISAWNTIKEICQPLITAFSQLKDALTGTGDGASIASACMGALKVVATALEYIIRGALEVVLKIVEVIVGLVVPALTFLVNGITNIVTLITTVVNAIWLWINGSISFSDMMTMIWEALVAFITNMYNNLLLLFQQIYNNLVLILGGVLSYIFEWVQSLIMRGIEAGVGFVSGIVNYIMGLPAQFLQWLTEVIVRVATWLAELLVKAKDAGEGFVTKVINYIKSLPSKLAQYLTQCITRITSWISNLKSKATTAASNFVTTFINKIKELPGKVADEMVNIAKSVINKIPDLISAAKQAATDMLNGFLDALGIHSPGYMSQNMDEETDRVLDTLVTKKEEIANASSQLADAITDNFGDPTLETTSITDTSTLPTTSSISDISTIPDTTTTATSNVTSTSTQTVNTDVNSTGLDQLVTEDTVNQTLTGVSEIQNAITTATSTINTQLQTTMTTMNTLSTTSTITKNQLLANNTSTIASFNTLTNNITKSLDTIESNNTSQWTSIKNTTETQLNSILSSTKSVTTQMISAWNTMKNSIVSAAENIKSQSTSRFNTLSSTIKTFYNKLNNPGGWGTPNSTSSHTGRVKRTTGFSSIGSALSFASNSASQNPTKIVTRGNIRLNRCYDDTCIPYVTPHQMDNTTLGVLNENGCVDCILDKQIQEKMGAGWASTVAPNVKYIDTTSDEWDMKGPRVIGKYDTGTVFQVKDFEGGSPDISFGTFKEMMENVFSQCTYSFYYDSEKYGSWQAAFQNGAMNCSDSTDALIWMARVCGLSASKVHGHWNQFGHYWATVNGHKMDTTGWMTRRTWTPSASHAGPGPDISSEVSSQSEDVNHSGEITINIQHSIDANNVEGVSKEELLSALSSITDDPEWIRNLVNNSYYQDLDTKIKMKNTLKTMRNGT